MDTDREKRAPVEKFERRVFNLQNCEIRSAEGSDGPVTFTGYAAVFNELSVPLGGFRERIAPGCFRDALDAGQDVRFLINHDANYILGRSTSGTLKLTEDEVGLRVECELGNQTYAQDLAESMRRGDIDQMSFGFVTRADDWQEKDPETGLPIRELLRADLFDVSAVVYPAYPDTTAEVRSFDPETAAELEERAAAALAEIEARAAGDAVPTETGDETELPEDEQPPAPAKLENDTVDADEEDVEAPNETVQHGGRAGKKLSKASSDTIQSAISAISGTLTDLQSFLDSTVGTNSADPQPALPDFAGFVAVLRQERELAQFEEREWDWDDDYEVYLLTSMVACASAFMEMADDTVEMSQIAQELTALLTTEIGEALLERSLSTPARENRPSFTAFRDAVKACMAESRDWKWVDDYCVYVVTQMISLGSSFMVCEEDDADVQTMASIVQRLTALLAAQLAAGEAEPEPAPEMNAATWAIENRRRRLSLLEKEIV